MTSRLSIHSILATTAAKVAVVAATTATVAAVGLTAASAAPGAPAHAARGNVFPFALQQSSAGITGCLPNASGSATVTRGSLNDVMKVSVHGLAPSTGYALFIIQQPTAPFGLAWYQTDIHTDSTGSGSATVQGVFNRETFSVSLGGSAATFSPTSMFHVGIWFDNPRVPFNLGCEPGATQPIVTPFDGDRGAGVQVLNTGQFPVNAGPLSQIPD